MYPFVRSCHCLGVNSTIWRDFPGFIRLNADKYRFPPFSMEFSDFRLLGPMSVLLGSTPILALSVLSGVLYALIWAYCGAYRTRTYALYAHI